MCSGCLLPHAFGKPIDCTPSLFSPSPLLSWMSLWRFFRSCGVVKIRKLVFTQVPTIHLLLGLHPLLRRTLIVAPDPFYRGQDWVTFFLRTPWWGGLFVDRRTGCRTGGSGCHTGLLPNFHLPKLAFGPTLILTAFRSPSRVAPGHSEVDKYPPLARSDTWRFALVRL